MEPNIISIDWSRNRNFQEKDNKKILYKIQPPFLIKQIKKINISHMEHDLNGKNMDDEEQKNLKNDPLTYMCWLLLYFMKQKITTEFF